MLSAVPESRSSAEQKAMSKKLQRRLPPEHCRCVKISIAITIIMVKDTPVVLTVAEAAAVHIDKVDDISELRCLLQLLFYFLFCGRETRVKNYRCCHDYRAGEAAQPQIAVSFGVKRT